jgi:hypothetical protein
VFFAVRFGALLAPAAASGEANVLARSWTLSAGNFWRLLGVLVAVFLPVLVVASIVEAMLAGPGPVLDTTSDKLLMISGLTRAREVLPLMSGLGFLFSPILIALYCGAAVSAWRTVKKEPAEAPVA